ncbi:holo-ACP synthase [Alkalicoccus halolimnae]|uniref:Holo-[acyl-carrier-protein] synthase n=1 Tax=Alkalicoccus halolimnae TaxID=1667239 RepID=A0A5C7FBI8_9BACI|nr:holo-ACP synthase [Alkalicoccus halolimnae]TXF83964.1 holo-ACP synthase [Alkalicoccus halolimnae]
MIRGIGIDITELDRIGKISARLAERVLTKSEKEIYAELPPKRRTEFLAGRFAVKEAYAKACGCGIGSRLSFQDIELSNDELGKPVLQAVGENDTVHVSISHSREFACAQVIIEKNENMAGEKA